MTRPSIRHFAGQLYGVKPYPNQNLKSPENTGGKVFAGRCRSEQI
jgi:hypothetical protein